MASYLASNCKQRVILDNGECPCDDIAFLHIIFARKLWHSDLEAGLIGEHLVSPLAVFHMHATNVGRI
eukprot:12430936-Karenia_brevis.AAC.1